MATVEKPNDEDPTATEPQRQRISFAADVIAKSLEAEKEENERREKWREISIALDRFFLLFFTAVFVLSTIAVYSQTG